jgi:predicted ATPase/transcriptional regulator with XRE-family HTH domain
VNAGCVTITEVNVSKYVAEWRMDQDGSASFGKVLRYLRVTSGLTQEELSHRSGVSTRGIRRLETGDRQTPRLETVRLLAGAMSLNEEDRKRLLNAARPELGTPFNGKRTPPADPEPGRMRAASSSLPIPLTPLVGRQAIEQTIGQMLLGDQVRLLTITGPPGIGKTRLAVEVGRALIADFPSGVRFVSLAPLADASLVVPRVVEALDATTPQREITLDDLAGWIGAARMLLVLDNFEHLLPAAPFVPELLGRCPNLKVVATSRSRLRVSGEYQFPVPPLELPASDPDTPGGLQPRSEAEKLFELRARSVDPGFRWTEAIAPLVAGICKRVDGLPLAIELAAAQLSVRSVADIASHAQQLLPVLDDGPRDQPERLQTMTKSLEWSYSLLSPDEQALLRRLAVFRGGFSIDATRAVDARSVDAVQTNTTLGALVERNLVVRSELAGNPRFTLLELIREYAGGLLEDAGESELVREAHAAYFLVKAGTYDRYYWIPRDRNVPERFAEELPNFREALRWFEELGDGERMLTLAGALIGFWTTHSNLQEGRDWLERAIALGSGASPLARSRGLLAAGQIRFYLGDHKQASRDYAAAIGEAVASGDALRVACASSANAALAGLGGKYLEAKTLCEQTLRATEQIEDRELAQAIAIWIPGTLGRAEHGLGNLTRADEHFRAAAHQMREFDQPRGASRVFEAWGTLAVDQGEMTRAEERYLQGAHLAYSSGDDIHTAINLAMLASARAIMGERTAAMRLLGAVQAFEWRNGPLVSLTEMDRRVQERALERLWETLDPAELEAARAAGAELTLSQALEEALATSETPGLDDVITQAAMRPVVRQFGPGFTH